MGYTDLLEVIEQRDAEKKLCAGQEWAASRCPFCGYYPVTEIQEHGHYRTECCKQITQGCCNGETG